MTTVIDPNKRYLASDAPREITLAFFRQERMRNLLFRDGNGMYLELLLTLLLNQEPSGDFLGPYRLADLFATDQVIDGKKYMCFKFTAPTQRNRGYRYSASNWNRGSLWTHKIRHWCLTK